MDTRINAQPQPRLFNWNRPKPVPQAQVAPRPQVMAGDRLQLSGARPTGGSSHGPSSSQLTGEMPDLAGMLQGLDPMFAMAFLEALMTMYMLGLRQGQGHPMHGARPPQDMPAAPQPPAPPAAQPPVVVVPVNPQPKPAPSKPSAPAAAGIPPLPSGAKVVKPDLSGNAAAKLQAAIDSLGPNGGVVQLPPGEFQLDKAISLRSNVHVAGTPGQTVLKGTATNGMFRNFNTQNTSIRDLVLDGQGKASQGMYAGRAKDIGIYNTEIKNMAANGTYMSGTGVYFESEVTDSRIIGNHIHDLGQGEETAIGIGMARGSHRNVMTHNTIENVGRNGIGVNTDSHDLYIAHNEITQVRGHGLSVELWKNCSGITENNKLASWVSYDKSTGAIRNNVIDSAWSPKRALMGIEVVAVEGGLTVENNTVKGAKYGLSISRGTDDVLFKNNVFENVYWGGSIYVDGDPSTGNRFIGNTFRGDGASDGRGLFLNGSSNHTVVQGNTVENFKLPYIVHGTDKSTLTVEGNTGF